MLDIFTYITPCFKSEVFWTALGAIGTIAVSAISILQVSARHREDELKNNTVLLVPEHNEYRMDNWRVIDRSTAFEHKYHKPHFADNEMAFYKQNTKLKFLEMVFSLKAFNECIPNRFDIQWLKLEVGNKIIASNDLIKGGKGIIANFENPFFIRIRIIDDDINLLDYNVLKCGIAFYKESGNKEYRTEYECCFKFSAYNTGPVNDMYSAEIINQVLYRSSKTTRIRVRKYNILRRLKNGQQRNQSDR